MTETSSERDDRLVTNFREYKRAKWQELRDEIFGRAGEDLRSQFDLALDNADISMVDLLQDTRLNVAGIRLEELTRLEEMERKIREGTYGLCDHCGEPIPEERMKVMPYATDCVPCREKKEKGTYPPPKSTM
ncbi:MAG TPA: TraR/DksA C4-type zinc finger protein [Verrucomicrobiae bacterium]|nr:TraR/DksA C4-type zinc finger protein [Verrucomicrobiae bacterium]